MKKIFTITVLFLFSFVLPSFAQEDNGERSRTIEIKAKKFSYTPNIIEVNKGERVKIRLISEDVTHGFYLDGYGLETKANPGQDSSISFVADKTGRFAFRCSVTCGEFHPYMIGYLVVGPNLRFRNYVFLTLFLGLGSLAVIFLKKRD
ncbi:MAG: cupredoxin domain-containing protein [Omnitrophica bacterium]|nr:cupredoxin domain-containing protein [Candidatus Omnitrophota bacterium]